MPASETLPHATLCHPIEDYYEVTEKVRKGEYFREARSIYNCLFHDTISERYLYVLLSLVSIVTFLISIKAMEDYYPLNSSVPIIIRTDLTSEDSTYIRPLMQSKKDNANEALLSYLVANFVRAWEEYDIMKFDRDAGTIKSQSSPQLLKAYNDYIDPHNPESPITLYQRHSKRRITLVGLSVNAKGAEAIFDATVDGPTDTKKSRWVANMSFQYDGIALDNDTGKAKPLHYVVNEYHSKRLQDIR